ncbi:hypothetical protein EVAR_25485_1 [Eumeta japonica]|uniref:ATP-dependent DNA helicase n=1 Tax=Eumeta variegata TaxID=151549 RepID=A0A4C1VM27_EUMVA|nr:hypothetical protein EVAR_25485_1 [Eumeta japonica]
MVGTEFERRDIIHLRNENLRRVAETHRSYDALQYPVLFPRGEDGYHFNVMQVNLNLNNKDICLSINIKVLSQLGMPALIRTKDNIYDSYLTREQLYDVQQLQHYVDTHVKLLMPDQKNAYDKIMQRVTNEIGGIFFFDAPGGQAKHT